MVSVSVESPEQTDLRLRRVIAEAEFVVHDGVWTFSETPEPPVLTDEMLAVVRDTEVWSALVPVSPELTGGERFGLFSFHFPGAPDNSGFVGWLAGHLKRELGTGVFVVCGSNTARGGIFDYWGSPAELLPQAVEVVERLRANT